MKKCFFVLFLCFYQNVLANKVVHIKTINRDDYIRVLFETAEKPIYFVKELEIGKIEVLLPNTILSAPIHKKIDKMNIINDILLFMNGKDARFVILTNGNRLKRYLYTNPTENNSYYTLIIDINKKFSDLNDIIGILPIKDENETISDLISQNNLFEIKSVEELLNINNIISEEDIKNLEKQNNSDFNLVDFINTIVVKEKTSKSAQTTKKKVQKDEQKPVEKYFTVVLDAGHGGKDPGAIGKRKLKEKDVNLAFVKEIAKELKKYKNIRIFLTRSDDTFVNLDDRVRKSMMWNADLFISIHADANKNSKSKGLSIYTLDDYGFNERSLKIVKAQYSTFNYYKNRHFFIKEAKNNSITKSIYFSSKVLDKMKKNGVKMLDNPIKRANFAVLISPNYPSLLIELGFLSNYEDEKMLASLAYREKIAKIISSAIGEYAKQ
ncbi:MAG: N-acetylmuramoyl-L-alanine amidase [Rickettsiales bacterium]|jgi:N-acetylmuramoyl-L-alanine amidase|nr:N-acetylmuramoyl-L-alanine amidase [Rickettsiales bacterium]